MTITYEYAKEIAGYYAYGVSAGEILARFSQGHDVDKQDMLEDIILTAKDHGKFNTGLQQLLEYAIFDL